MRSASSLRYRLDLGSWRLTRGGSEGHEIAMISRYGVWESCSREREMKAEWSRNWVRNASPSKYRPDLESWR